MKALEAAKNMTVRSDRNAIKMLMEDHREVETLFQSFESAAGASRKAAIVSEICQSLAVHAQIEEQIFYPASRGVLDGDDEAMVDEAVVEHATLKYLMKNLQGMHADDPLFTGHVTVLKEYIQHHVSEEESDYFPKVAATSLDLDAIGERMHELKERLMREAPSRTAGDTVRFATVVVRPVSRQRAIGRAAATRRSRQASGHRARR